VTLRVLHVTTKRLLAAGAISRTTTDLGPRTLRIETGNPGSLHFLAAALRATTVLLIGSRSLLAVVETDTERVPSRGLKMRIPTMSAASTTNSPTTNLAARIASSNYQRYGKMSDAGSGDAGAEARRSQ
jgi:hypothetical protein